MIKMQPFFFFLFLSLSFSPCPSIFPPFSLFLFFCLSPFLFTFVLMKLISIISSCLHTLIPNIKFLFVCHYKSFKMKSGYEPPKLNRFYVIHNSRNHVYFSLSVSLILKTPFLYFMFHFKVDKCCYCYGQ